MLDVSDQQVDEYSKQSLAKLLVLKLHHRMPKAV